MKARKPVVAGQFYPGTEAALKSQISNLIDKKAKKVDALGAILPHAGYVYSAAVAASVASQLKTYNTYIILGPNHTGRGPSISVFDGDAWQTPLGEVKINKDLVKKIADCDNFELDLSAHQFEHSIEVELPLFQYTNEKFDFVPIVVGTSDLKILKQAGKSLAKVINGQGSILVIASSDMTHYESDENARQKDNQAIEAIKRLDEDLLMKRVQEMDISMCGYGPTIIMLSCVKELGAKAAKLVKYQTSGDVSGDYSSVVGYAGVIVS